MLGLVVVLSVGGLIWARWQKSREDYVEHSDDKYHTLWIIGAFVIFILTSSWALWMFGGILLIALVKVVRGDD
jgi:predicted membrane channel-forming protein YqfA (hemolysin III family)